MFPSRTSEPQNHKRNKLILEYQYPTGTVSQMGRKAVYRVRFENPAVTLWYSYRTLVALHTPDALYYTTEKFSVTTTKQLNFIKKEVAFGATYRKCIALSLHELYTLYLSFNLKTEHVL